MQLCQLIALRCHFFFLQTHVIARILLCDSVITGTFSFVKHNHNSLRQNDFFFAKKKRKQSRIISLWIFFLVTKNSRHLRAFNAGTKARTGTSFVRVRSETLFSSSHSFSRSSLVFVSLHCKKKKKQFRVLLFL